jgi:uncharacterized glyoxalase superfamily protein PhnB
VTDSYKTGEPPQGILARMNRIIAGVIVKDVEAAGAFYVRHLGAKVVFDCGWYTTLRLGGPKGPEVSFMAPRGPEHTPVPPGALSLYVEVDDVDATYERVRATGAPVDGPPSDKPWGDRSFALADPQGVRVYLFSPRPMSAEFAGFLKG